MNPELFDKSTGRVVRAPAGYWAFVPNPLPASFLWTSDQPVLNVRQMESALGVNYSTAQRYVQQLAEVGLLQEVTGQARNRVYQSEAILRAIDEPLPDEHK